MAFKTGRSDLAAESVFGAGKTTSLAFLLVWFALTATHATIAVAHKENPAGQAMASMIARTRLPTALREQFVPVVSAHAHEKEKHFPKMSYPLTSVRSGRVR